MNQQEPIARLRDMIAVLESLPAFVPAAFPASDSGAWFGSLDRIARDDMQQLHAWLTERGWQVAESFVDTLGEQTRFTHPEHTARLNFMSIPAAPGAVLCNCRERLSSDRCPVHRRAS